VAEYFKEFFIVADHILPTLSEPAWQKMAQSPLNGTIQPVDVKEEAHGQTMAEIKTNLFSQPTGYGSV